MGTRNETYDPETAAALLGEVGDESVAHAVRNLLSTNVLSKVNRDPTKPKPGRNLRISESNQNALNGPLSTEIFQDATALEGSSAQSQDEWREWPLLSSEGDTAALTHLASDGKVIMTLIISCPVILTDYLDSFQN
jgi:transcription factor C subunit 3